MSPTDQTVTIRSYGLAFALERRIFRIERYRLPLPYGLPLRGLAYAALALALVLLGERVTGLGALVSALPWPIRYLVLPAGAAQLLLGVRVDGRPAHQAAGAWITLRLALLFQAEHDVCLRLADVALAPDERDPGFRAAVVAGPGVVIVRLPARMRPGRGGRELRVRPERGRPGRRGVRVAPAGRRGVRVAPAGRRGVRVALKGGQRMRVQR